MRRIRIAIVENDKHAVENLTENLDRWQQENQNNVKLELSVFDRGEAFIHALREAEAGQAFQLVFMDIQLNGKLDGMETAKQLRIYGRKQILVFLTSYNSYILDGYDVDAIKYLLKPLKYPDLKSVMDKAVLRLGGERYLYRGKEETKWIPYEDIFYFQSARHYVDIVTEDGTLRQKCRLADVAEQLPSYFVQCHRVNIVNMHQISRIQGTDIFLKNNERLSVSGSFRERITAFVMEEIF